MSANILHNFFECRKRQKLDKTIPDHIDVRIFKAFPHIFQPDDCFASPSSCSSASKIRRKSSSEYAGFGT